VVALLAMVGSCRAPEARAVERSGEPNSSALAPPPDDAETTASMQRRGGAALARVPALVKRVAEVRGLGFTKDVPIGYQDEADARRQLLDENGGDLQAAVVAQIAAAMVHLGLLPRAMDLSRYLVDATVAMAGADYSAASKRIFVRQVLDDGRGPVEEQRAAEQQFDESIAHELTHALQDQRFDLSAYLAPTLDADALAARDYVVEGEAMIVGWACARGVAVSSEALAREFERSAAIDHLAEMAKDAQPDVPLVIVGPKLDVYYGGPIVILRAYQRGGWGEVARLYAHPPTSTAQVLHPDAKLFPTRREPRRIEIPLFAGYDDVHADVIGELGWRLYFMQWHTDDPAVAAAGWAGDRYRVMRRADGVLVGAIVTTWDRPADATEFVEAYAASVAARCPGELAADPRAVAGARRCDGHRIFLRRQGTRVFIVDGADDAALLDRLIASARIE
jgi:hypothetical protein